MDYSDFVQGITFRYIPPSIRRPIGFRGLNQFLRRVGVQLEAWNTRLPCDQAELEHRLRGIGHVPRMSTFAIGALINRGVEAMPPGQAFVNVGVWNGYTFFSGMVHNPDKRCIGLDNFSHKNSPRTAFLQRFEQIRSSQHKFHEADYRDYFRSIHREPIGFYLFDGPHSYQDQLEGLRLAEPFFAPNCLVLIDDTNWDQVRRANLDFISGSDYEYRMLLDVRTPKSGHPTFWNGIMLFQRGALKSRAGNLESQRPAA